jgi:multisubunit Na+/H+ antiporter MnhE subunit
MLGISVLIAVLHRAVDMGPLEEGIFSLQIAVRGLQLGIFFLIFWLARFFDLDYRQYAFGIAGGFGIAAAGILLGTLVRTGLGLKFLIFFEYVPAVSYCLAVAVWLASFVRPEPDDPFRDFRRLFTPELFLERLQRYKQEVKGIFKP